MSFRRLQGKEDFGSGSRFVFFLVFGSLLLLAVSVLFLFFGAERIEWKEIFEAVFFFDEENFNHVIVRDIRIPRLLADIIVGACLSISGAVMQGTTKNPIADSGIMGISSGSVFAVVLIVVFFPDVSRLGRIGISALGAGVVTLLIYLVALLAKRRASPEKMVLSGMAISTLLSSVTTAIILREGISGEMMRYTAGSSANTIWTDIAVSAPFFLFGLLLSFAISRSLTVMNLGDDVSKGLGANTFAVKALSTIVVLLMAAIAVVIIGPVGYVGLMIPHIVRRLVGVDYRYVLPVSGLLGGAMVVCCDLLARLIVAPYEFPIGVILSMIGVPFFLFVSRREQRSAFDD